MAEAGAVSGLSGAGGGGGGAPTWSGALTWAAELLERAGCDSPRLDAELLLASAVSATRTELYLTPGATLGRVGAGRFEELVARRAAREPVAYILGHKPFRRITLELDANVLVPRPETELLVEVGLGLPEGARVADVGTGSGAVALALKDERADLEIWGSDLSRAAVAVAHANAARLALDVPFIEGDLLVGGPYDAVLANLPYVASGDPLPPEVANYEPPSALYGGEDGLDLVRRLIGMLDGLELVALEIGAGQADVVDGLFGDAGFGRVERLRDLAGHERVLVGRR